MPKEREDALMEMEWPPSFRINEEDEPIQMSELDVTWIFCSVLGMKWKDALSITDDREKRFLYDKASVIAESQARTEQDLLQRQQEMEQRIHEKIEEIKPGEPMPDFPIPDPEELIEDEKKLKL